ncbi:MAG: ergothioneine biosynthesis protein EgtB [Balneolaceae bacterium]|nr:ergothioneine biosynthesis protein EgtB [Balneolaceae bacterium]
MDATAVKRTASNSTADRHSREHLIKRFKAIRKFSRQLTEPLEIEDYVVQAMENTSPTKWHLAHVSWFYETFLLDKVYDDYESLHPQYAYIFNSYYLQTGEPLTRSKRGLLTRPTVREVFEFREYVNKEVLKFLENATEEQLEEFGPVIEIGNNHEQQHQELMITDFKYMFAQNPLRPAYKDLELPESNKVPPLEWVSFDEGVYRIGNEGDEFTYDNEHPRHRTFLEAFELSDRLITNREYMKFIEDDGYERSELWLDDGWATVNENGWNSPLYWTKKDGEWHYFTLSGMRKVDPNEPVTHVSYYEADAYARWAGARLATEAEWEVAAGDRPYNGNFVEEGHFHPRPLQDSKQGLKQMYGDVWEWTKSAYDAYPGYEPLPGALGEYNGKFMCSQYVLRGGSCATSETHIRKTYRNFFYPDARWQFNGIRLARTIG